MDDETLVITASMPVRSCPPEGRLGAWMEVLRQGAFGALEWMLIGDDFEPFDRARAVAVAAAMEGEDVGFASSANGGGVEAKLTCGPERISLSVYVPRSCFPADGIDRARRALDQLLAAMPPAAHGRAFVDTIWHPQERSGHAFFERADLALATSPFDRCCWIVAVSAEVYDDCYQRSALLRTPAVVVEERGRRLWLQLYGSPFEYDTARAHEELRRAYGHFSQLSRERWDAEGDPDDAIAGPLPATGDVVSAIELGDELAGAMCNNLHRGVRVDRDRDRVLVTAVGGTPRACSIDELKDALSYSLEGVSRCLEVYEAESSAGPIAVMLEAEPPGTRMIDAGAMPEADAIGLLLQLVDLAERAHAWDITLVGLHPATCYVEQRSGRWVLTGVAPRAIPFLLAMPPMRGGLCLLEAYTALEARRGDVAGPAADVFSIRAIGALLLGEQLPAGTRLPELRAALRARL